LEIISGKLAVKLPGETAWKDFPEGSTFTVPPNSRFQLKVTEDSAYLCLYVE